jgi:hypothetical protein
MKAFALYAIATLGLIAAAGWLLGTGFPTPADQRAIRVSAGIAFGVQMLSFAVARLAGARNMIAGWGLGVLLRFVTLAVVALFLLKPLGLPSAAALISLATFFFISTVIEPLLLKV